MILFRVSTLLFAVSHERLRPFGSYDAESWDQAQEKCITRENCELPYGYFESEKSPGISSALFLPTYAGHLRYAIPA